YPAPLDPVRLLDLEQPPPEVRVLHRLAIGGAPAVADPALDPSGDAVADIYAVGEKPDAAGPLQRRQPLDRRGQLHAVVGGERLAARKLLLARARADDDAPAAGPRIALAGAVGENLDFGHGRRGIRRP